VYDPLRFSPSLLRDVEGASVAFFILILFIGVGFDDRTYEPWQRCAAEAAFLLTRIIILVPHVIVWAHNMVSVAVDTIDQSRGIC
jgi:hypothetical protein